MSLQANNNKEKEVSLLKTPAQNVIKNDPGFKATSAAARLTSDVTPAVASTNSKSLTSASNSNFNRF
jgi:hypothetical protein